MQNEFNTEEMIYLDRLLERHLKSLLQEIHHTDSRAFKKDLQTEYDFANSLRQKLIPHLSVKRSA